MKPEILKGLFKKSGMDLKGNLFFDEYGIRVVTARLLNDGGQERAWCKAVERYK